MLTKRKNSEHRPRGHDAAQGTVIAPEEAPSKLNRRSFLVQSGLAAGSLGGLGSIQLGAVRKAKAAGSSAVGPGTVIRKNICTHCSVGCTVTAEVVNGVWVGQEPSWASPINRGTHCAKGAAIRELVSSERRLKYPMKLEGGQWKRISWNQAIDEVGDRLLAIREKHGADSVYWLGSAKYTNEAAYLLRKFGAFWGTNNTDHQARICHSTTVAGVANTWGYGAQTNSYNDLRNAKTMIIIGGNPAEAHPISMQHILSGKEINRANLVVIDPRFTRTAAHATEYVRIRSGTDIPIAWGMLWHIFQNGWEDKEFIAQRVYGMDEVRKEVAKWTPDEVERVSGVPGGQLRRVAEMLAKAKPATLIWCMGNTQHTVGTANVRALCILCLATGNVGKPGTGANIFRGHTNVQGATDLGLDVTSLPLYYGLVEGGWRHWARVWEVEYEWLQSRFDEVPAAAGRKARTRKENMEAPGITSTRWFDAVNLPPEQIDQRSPIRAMMISGHGGNTVTRLPEALEGLNKLELMVVADPHPTTFAALDGRKDGTYLLPICTSLEMDGSRTASNRSLQWGEQIVKPAFESKNDYEFLYLLAKKLGFAESLFKNITVENNVPLAEDILREINRGGWSTGYCGQSPERLKAHMRNQHKFDLVTLRAPKDDPEVGGDYYGLPWPCWGKPELRHPGSALLYNTAIHVKDGGGTFRARFGTERNGETLLAENSYTKGSDLTDGYPEFTMAVLKKLGWEKDLTPEERAIIQTIGGDKVDTVNWATDLSGGIQRVCLDHGVMHYGNAKARANAWNLPDPVPVHREPIYSPRPELVAKYPTRPDERQFRMPNIGFSVQRSAVERNVARDFPIILTSGRLVEYEGGGEETRSNPWLAELQQDMFVEINTGDAAARGIADGQWVWVLGAENSSKTKVKALVTDRVGRGVAFMPFHFSGWYQGKDMRDFYPQGADPIVLGESVNTVTTYGFDPVTGMQEPKATLCQIRAA
ncbi:formate dehydrogenase subunit alpha [Methylobacterium sp. R2-1]|uniref:formate dehydrogenase subunit alpha n=1 Tax=Methylobacterium sp. R2-1 TaxID=2587064 RepID=UPI00181A7392|nr:formate dehydrogenase subunit alpha [Methylobacterium sp. R2-1]MBB2960972.1 formate dehydrogenase major subunit [Methylobacterium sp. R2-1]